jgi:hypothetical protein
MPAVMPGAGRLPVPTTLQVQIQKVQKIQKFQAASWRVLLVVGLLGARTVTFHVTLHENGSLNDPGWWVRIWIGAGGEPCCAEE